MAAVGIALVALLLAAVRDGYSLAGMRKAYAQGVSTGNTHADKALALNARQALFQARCMVEGMPTTMYAHERSGAVIAAGRIDGSAHVLIVGGKVADVVTDADGVRIVAQGSVKGGKAATFSTADACKAVYRNANTRGTANGGRSDADYYAHNAACTALKASLHVDRLRKSGIATHGIVVGVKVPQASKARKVK